MTALNKQAYRADGGDIGAGRLKEIADNAYGDEEKRWMAQRVLSLLDELEKEKGYASAFEAEKWHYHGLAESEGERADRAEKALEAAEKRIEDEICRANREHHRGFMMACNHLKEHANIHYADAAEMEIAALRQRIAELEARTVMLPTPYPKGYGLAADKYNFALEECADAIRAAGIGVKGE
jgi:hypothetical protein